MLEAPVHEGASDRPWLEAAFARAGRDLPSGPITTESLLGGRTGARVERLRVGAVSVVLKVQPFSSWRTEGMGIAGVGGEGPLWRSGLIAGGPVRWPVFDLSQTADAWWILMEDVGDQLRPRGAFTWADSERLFDQMARWHARFWEDPRLERPELPDVHATTRLFTEPLLHLAGRRESTQPWVASTLENFKVIGAFLPIFLDVLGEEWASRYLQLVADHAWQTELAGGPTTLVHGDLRRANIGFDGEDVVLLDWEFAARSPAAADLQWHCLLHYWGYPPAGIAQGVSTDPLRDLYLQTLRSQGVDVDPHAVHRSWDLSWIRAIAVLGYALVDPLFPDGGDEQTRDHVRSLCVRAVRRAWEIRQGAVG